MKIIITTSEILSILAIKHNMDVNPIDLTIVQDNGVTITQMESPYVKGIKETCRLFPNYATDQKMLAIKHLRFVVAGLGLADAKTAIENPDKAIAYWTTNNKILPYTY